MANEAALQHLADDMAKVRAFVDQIKGYALSLKTLVEAGAVTVTNFPASVPVTGAFWPAVQTVSGALSVNNFPAPAYPALGVQRTHVALSATGTVVAAQGGQAIRMLSAVLTATVAVNAEFRGAGATTLMGGLAIPVAPSLVLPFDPYGWCQTAAGDPLRLAFTGVLTVAASVRWVAM